MIAWLFHVSDSKTPLFGLAVGVLILLGSGFARVRKYWSSYFVVTLIVFGVLQLTMDVSATLIASAGRNSTLTGRTDLWESVIDMTVSPWFGAGFASFWLGDRLEKLWAQFFFQPNQAHNGYLDTYLNLGWFGLVFFTGVIVSGYRTVRRRWTHFIGPTDRDAVERDFARFRMAFLVGFLVYNVTEGAIQSLNFLFVLLLIVVIEPSMREALRRGDRPGTRIAPAAEPRLNVEKRRPAWSGPVKGRYGSVPSAPASPVPATPPRTGGSRRT